MESFKGYIRNILPVVRNIAMSSLQTDETEIHFYFRIQ